MITPHAHLDCTGLRCPLPIVKVSLAMRTMAAGERLLVEATDPAFRPDIMAWTRQLGHRLVSFEPGAVQRALIEKA
jgi:tRNA 2-thiouridine synthesizing protein A